MPKQTLIAIGAGILSAMSATAILVGVPGAMILAYLAPLPLFMAGLGLGPRGAALGGLAGFMAAGMLGGGTWAGVFGLTQGLPAWMMTRHLLLQRPAEAGDGPPGAVEWYPIGDMLCGLAALAAAGFAVLAIAGAGQEGGLSKLIESNLGAVLAAMLPDLDAARREGALGMLTPLFPGAIGVSWLIMLVVNAALAQSVLTKLKWNQRPTPEYAALTLPNWMSWPLVGSAALALMGSGEMEYTGRNLAMILAVPYFLLGLAVVHAWARRVSYTLPILVAIYTMVVVWVWATVAIVGVGLAEQWSGLRRRLPAAGGGPAANDE